MQERTQIKIAIMKECIERHTFKSEVIREFIQLAGCHLSTAEDYFLLVKRGYPSKRITNAGLRRETKKANSKICYFCGKAVEENHHYDYLNDKTVSLCQSCHKKVHWLFERYSKIIQIKDTQLMGIKSILMGKCEAHNVPKKEGEGKNEDKIRTNGRS